MWRNNNNNGAPTTWSCVLKIKTEQDKPFNKTHKQHTLLQDIFAKLRKHLFMGIATTKAEVATRTGLLHRQKHMQQVVGSTVREVHPGVVEIIYYCQRAL